MSQHRRLKQEKPGTSEWCPVWLKTAGDRVFSHDSIPCSARAYILLIILTGLALFTYSLISVVTGSDFRWLSLVFLTVIASHFTVTLPLSKENASASITMGDVFVFTAVFLFGPEVAVIIATIEGLTMNLRAKVSRRYKQVFNLAQLTIVSFCVSHAFYHLNGGTPPLDPYEIADQTRFLVAAGLCGLIYFALNTGLISYALSLSMRRSIIEIWRGNFTWAWITHFSGASLAALTFLWFEDSTLYSVTVAIPVVLLTYYAYKMNLSRIRQAQSHLHEVQGLLAEKIEAEKALQKAKDELEVRVLERTTELREANRRLTVEVRDRMSAENELASEKERLAVTLRSIADGVITTDTRGQVTLVNMIAEELTGWKQKEAAGKQLDEVFKVIHRGSGEPSEDITRKVLASGEIVSIEGKDIVIVSKNGKQRSISQSGAPILDKSGNTVGVVIVFRDITYEKRMEEELFKAQKLESVGILAGGIAHDFNNILSGILLKTQLAQRALKKGKDADSLLSSVEEATTRATALTQQLLTFAKGGAPIKKTASIKDLLMESATFVLRGSKVRCHFEISPELWAVEVDEGQINQVINNLVINAEQSMAKGGNLRLKAENIEISETELRGKLTPGQYVRVAISDEGIGIAPDDLEKIFDPYFSTKPKGHGLGLASTYSIIQRHGGYIEVESVLNQGTTFFFYLPASTATPVAKPRKVDKGAARGAGRILVMDDEKILRECCGELLTELGYQVDFAHDGEEAIQKYRSARQINSPFDAVIMDLTIPGGMGGKEAIEHLQRLDPQIKAIVSSGYSDNPVMANYREFGFSAVLTKPFTLHDLAGILEDLVSNPAEDIQRSA